MTSGGATGGDGVRSDAGGDPLVVVGGGITGLAAAWEGMQQGMDVTLREASDRLGGLIRTSGMPLGDGTTMEIDEAADAFLARVPEAVELCEELGLADRFTEPAATRAMVHTAEGLRWFPDNTVLGVPLDPSDVEATGLLDERGLASVRSEVARDDEPLTGDTSVGALLRERFGGQLVDRVVGPLVGGISAGDVDEMSLRATTPQLAAAASRPGSLSANLGEARGSAPQGPVFHGLLGGTGVLVDTLARELEQRGVELCTSDPVGRLRDEDLEGHRFVVTTGASTAADLLCGVSPGAAEMIATIPTATVVLVTYVFDAADPTVGAAVGSGASGFLVPRGSGLLLTAVSWGSNKWSHWNDGRHVVVRASAGHSKDARVESMSDQEVSAAILSDLATTAGITASPAAVRVSRWADGFHQYGVGHLDAVERAERTLASETAGRVAIAGAAYRGVGIPACIRQGREAVRSFGGGVPLDGAVTPR